MKPIIKSLREYKSAENISCPLMLIEGVEDVSYGELVEIASGPHEKRWEKFWKYIRIKRLSKFLKGLLV
jgi:vacuolar-type H+-ATPase subunit B/Vma2